MDLGQPWDPLPALTAGSAATSAGKIKKTAPEERAGWWANGLPCEHRQPLEKDRTVGELLIEGRSGGSLSRGNSPSFPHAVVEELF